MRSRFLAGRPLAIAALSFVACVDPTPPVEELENPAEIQAIDALREMLQESHTQSDSEELAVFFSRDAILLPPAHPAVQGREEIQKYFGKIFQTWGTKLYLESRELHVMSDWALDRGVYQVDLVPHEEATEPIREQGNYIAVLRRGADASWKLARSIWNSDAASPSERSR